MRTSCFCIIPLLLLIVSHSFAQQNALKPYKIEGHINIDTGKVELLMANDKAFYSNGNEKLTAVLKDGKFTFEGFLSTPESYAIGYGTHYRSKPFIIEQGTQSLTWDVNSRYGVPQVDNQAMKEYFSLYLLAYKEVDFKRDSVDKKWEEVRKLYNNQVPIEIKLPYSRQFQAGYAANDQVLLKYVTNHPDSYLALWKLIQLFPFGYYDVFNDIASRFSPALLSSIPGKMMSVSLKQMGIRGIGRKFPSLNSLNERGDKLDSLLFNKNKYTLVDFWYSNCGPCIAQFEDFKKVYGKYKSKGLEIAGVSVDKTGDKKAMDNIIAKYKIDWQRYWDKDGLEAKRLLINAFPTNFLLDKNGVIVKSNISPSELDEFLESKLQLAL